MTHELVKSDAELINDIASELNRLSYRWTDPEAFFIRRNDLVKRLRRMADRLAPVPEAKDATTTWVPTGGSGVQPPPVRTRTRTVFIIRRD